MKILQTNIPKREVIGIDSMSITYVKENDCLSSSDLDQHITITARIDIPFDEDNPVDSWFYDISIPEGEHWSVESEEELAMLLRDFKQRFAMKGVTHE